MTAPPVLFVPAYHLAVARPRSRPGITLSLIGGLRSFDLIWTMTGGGPGFASDTIASVICKQYQRQVLLWPVDAGSVVLFLLVSAIIVPLTWWLNRQEVDR